MIVLLLTPGKALGYLEAPSTHKKQNVLCMMYKFYSYYIVKTDIQGHTYAAIFLCFLYLICITQTFVKVKLSKSNSSNENCLLKHLTLIVGHFRATFETKEKICSKLMVFIFLSHQAIKFRAINFHRNYLLWIFGILIKSPKFLPRIIQSRLTGMSYFIYNLMETKTL